jgi:hypothetical protein
VAARAWTPPSTTYARSIFLSTTHEDVTTIKQSVKDAMVWIAKYGTPLVAGLIAGKKR